MTEAVLAILGAWVLASVMVGALIITVRSWLDHRHRQSAGEPAHVRMVRRRPAG